MSGNRERVYVIDVLRFIAAFGVLLYHVTWRGPTIDHLGAAEYPELIGATRYLNLGVRLFFMISGFVIFYSIEGKRPLQFVWSRFVRLMPTYWLCSAITFMVCSHLWRPHYTATFHDWLVNLTMLQGYFKVQHIDPPYWTLVEELHFYVLTFALMLFGVAHRRLTFAALWIALSAIDSVVKVPLAHYEMTLEHAPFFAAGVIFYDLFKDGPKRVHGPLILFAFAVGLRQFHHWVEIDGRTAGAVCSPLVITAILFLIFMTFYLVATRRWVIRERHFTVAALGGITYPLYLLHNSIGLTTLIALHGSLDRWSALALVCLGSVAFAYAIWRWFEVPVMRALHKLGGRLGL